MLIVFSLSLSFDSIIDQSVDVVESPKNFIFLFWVCVIYNPNFSFFFFFFWGGGGGSS